MHHKLPCRSPAAALASTGDEMCCYKRAEGRFPHAGGAQSRGAPPPRRRSLAEGAQAPHERVQMNSLGNTEQVLILVAQQAAYLAASTLICTSVDANSSAMLLPPKSNIQQTHTAFGMLAQMSCTHGLQKHVMYHVQARLQCVMLPCAQGPRGQTRDMLHTNAAKKSSVKPQIQQNSELLVSMSHLCSLSKIC